MALTEAQLRMFEQLQQTTREQIELVIRAEIRPVQSDIAEIKSTVAELQRAIRGYNGTVGVIGKLSSVEQKLNSSLDSINARVDEAARIASGASCELTQYKLSMQSLESGINHLKEEQKETKSREKEEREEQEKKENQYGSWTWFRDKWFQPFLFAALLVLYELAKNKLGFP